jgi:hypothetical protein
MSVKKEGVNWRRTGKEHSGGTRTETNNQQRGTRTKWGSGEWERDELCGRRTTNGVIQTRKNPSNNGTARSERPSGGRQRPRSNVQGVNAGTGANPAKVWRRTNNVVTNRNKQSRTCNVSNQPNHRKVRKGPTPVIPRNLTELATVWGPFQQQPTNPRSGNLDRIRQRRTLNVIQRNNVQRKPRRPASRWGTGNQR